MSIERTCRAVFAARRQELTRRFGGAVLLAAGHPVCRNFPAYTYPFRASSHFLYLVGEHLPGAALLLHEGGATVFATPPDRSDALWHGPRPDFTQLGELLGVEVVRSLADVDDALAAIDAPIATIPPQDPRSAAWLTERLGRSVATQGASTLREGSPDAALADALVALRLLHDEAALTQIRAAADATVAACRAGMGATCVDGTEAEVLAAITGTLRARRMSDAFLPIVSVRGEVLHNEDHDGRTGAGDLLLADLGAETPEGWAADITRVWPVSGRFSSTQRAAYEVVLNTQEAAIAAATAGASYRSVHEMAKRTLVAGLRDLGVFRGEIDGLLERGAAAIFFPHGVGHLMGLDVHDMEDLGDRAGYAPGRVRSESFGDAYLRLDRDLEPGMVVTVEPGFYQVPAILADDAYTGAVGADLDREALARFADVRGIRIEDDVLITTAGPEVLTAAAPKHPDEVERAVAG